MNKKIYIETYGCQMNVVDSEVIFSIMRKEGYERTTVMEEADIILANTCSVRDNAEQRIWGRIEVFRKRKESNPGVIVGIVGCMAERLKEELTKTGKVDLVAGPDTYRTIPDMIKEIAPGNPAINVLLSREETYADIIPVRTDKNGVSAFISIMRGCNNVCSYCVVPYTRGAERSRDPETILSEAREVFSRGYKEVTLLGQNVDSYLWTDGQTKVDFPDLLESVALIDPSLRVRFATNHPKDISDKLIQTMARHDNICDHIHLPVQSGSDRMLEKMRRRYTREWYLDRVRKIREILPGCGITTDVIAGFCSETEEDHQATLSLFKEVAFDYAYMFCYSERPGTIAARHYPDDIPQEVKTRRLNEIIELQNQLSLESNRSDIGKTFEVLVEGPSKRNPDELCGRTGSDKMCVFPGSGHKAGDYVHVRIADCTSATLLGTIVE
ncbi:MAG: tRNA (N6-isopentenyl adenosine(37)-C2)-methylthiotransferase MiaB [Bacteroidales bacterium]|nr:tRNA (N6-isopentenyl adenosine(37)-C2)-methylthiotransferase MiaB [Bacteroidales bacterium]